MRQSFPKLTRLSNPASPDRFGIAETPLGAILFAWQDKALVRIHVLPAGGENYIHDLFHDWEWRLRMTRDDKAAATVASKALFPANKWTGVFPDDLTLGFYGTDFQYEAMAKMLKIPSGKTVSYGDLAKATSAPRAARAIGSICARNPLALIVPCHRVLAANSLGGYGLLGLGMKRQLLEWEAK